MKILLTALSAKNIHKTLAPWCLKAYCDEYNPSCEVVVAEYTINENIFDIADNIYLQKPDIIGLSCYIWNVEQILKLTSLIKQLLPHCIIVLGGPECSFEQDLSDFPCADYIIAGEGEQKFSKLIELIENGVSPEKGVIHGGNSVPFSELPTPFTAEYFASFAKGKMKSAENQLIYFEGTRGCPFSCAYCLSSVNSGVECFSFSRIREELEKLIGYGAKCIKFVDRTFNANKKLAKEILSYILNLETDCTFHFEAAADLFDEGMFAIIEKMPPCRIQFELGIQTVNEKTLEEINRKTDIDLVFRNIEKLVSFGNCHIHVDLIAGLPFDTLESFKLAINRSISARPHMLQLGFLKLLKGSKLRKSSEEYGYVYSAFPPYQCLKNNYISADKIIFLKEIEAVADKFYNSGMYQNSVNFAISEIFDSAYDFFSELAVFCRGKNTKVTLKNSYTILLNFLLKHTTKEQAEHYVKLDCISFDRKAMLPDAIANLRDKKAENEYRNNKENPQAVRIESFELDGKKRLIDYTVKNPVTGAFKIEIIN